MIPDPVTLSIARRTPYRYEVVHQALALLALNGWAPEQAERGILRIASSGLLTLNALLSAGELAPSIDDGLQALGA